MSSNGARAGAAALLLLAAPASADDTSAGVPAGVFRAEPAGGVALGAVAVTLDGEQVRVALSVSARGRAAVRLDLPRFAWLGEGELYPDRHFPELTVEVDGRAAAPADSFVATVGTKDVRSDVTGAVRAAGVDPFAIAETPPFVQPAPGRQAAFDALVAAGAVRQAPEGMLATWSAARTVRVTPGAGAHVVAFRYKARPAFALQQAGAPDVRWADYCTTAGAAARVLARAGLRGGFVAKQYVVPVALYGARPRAVTLRVSSDAGGAAIVCGSGGRALVDPAGVVPVRAGADGTIRVLRMVRPG